MTNRIILALSFAVLIIGGAILFVGARTPSTSTASEQNVRIVDGVQVIDLTVKGGYTPLRSVAKAGVPTVLRLATKNTFDCSSAVRIPTLGVSKNLPPSGVTEINLGVPEVGLLEGTCSMGMYPFAIEFTS